MTEERIEVIRSADQKAASTTPGLSRIRAFDSPGIIFAKSIIGPKIVSGWHHHGSRNLYGYVLQGMLDLEYAGGSVRIAEGDFFHVPVGLVHRDVNPDSSVSAVLVNLFLGEGDPVVNVNPPAT
jgi:quercetin dioxygenase-like cupin family protein